MPIGGSLLLLWRKVGDEHFQRLSTVLFEKFYDDPGEVEDASVIVYQDDPIRCVHGCATVLLEHAEQPLWRAP